MADKSEQNEEQARDDADKAALTRESATAATRSLITSFVWAMCAGWCLGLGQLIGCAVFIWCAGFSTCQSIYRYDRYCRLRDGVPL